jgi:hypothetical protein
MQADADAGEPWDTWRDRPIVDESLEWIFVAWQMLHCGRDYTFNGTPCAIRQTEIGWWLENRGIDDRDRRSLFAACIAAMDSALFAWHHEMAAERGDK